MSYEKMSAVKDSSADLKRSIKCKIGWLAELFGALEDNACNLSDGDDCLKFLRNPTFSKELWNELDNDYRNQKFDEDKYKKYNIKLLFHLATQCVLKVSLFKNNGLAEQLKDCRFQQEFIFISYMRMTGKMYDLAGLENAKEKLMIDVIDVILHNYQHNANTTKEAVKNIAGKLITGMIQKETTEIDELRLQLLIEHGVELLRCLFSKEILTDIYNDLDNILNYFNYLEPDSSILPTQLEQAYYKQIVNTKKRIDSKEPTFDSVTGVQLRTPKATKGEQWTTYLKLSDIDIHILFKRFICLLYRCQWLHPNQVYCRNIPYSKQLYFCMDILKWIMDCIEKNFNIARPSEREKLHQKKFMLRNTFVNYTSTILAVNHSGPDMRWMKRFVRDRLDS